MNVGQLVFSPASSNLTLLAKATADAVSTNNFKEAMVSAIDPKLADTAAFCEYYKVGLNVSANCVIVEAKRADRVWYAACIILATTRADINGVVRRYLDARKVSFAHMDKAVLLSGMEYGGITPIGLPGDWDLLVDKSVVDTEYVIIGSGIRGSKMLVPGQLLGSLPHAATLDIVKR